MSDRPPHAPPRRIELHTATRRLLLDGRPTPIGGRALDLLRVLARERGRVVDTEVLCAQVWPGGAVEPNNVQVQVWALRRLLGHEAIVTVPRRGYRLLREVLLLDHDAAGAADLAPSLADLLQQLRARRLVTLLGGSIDVATAVAQAYRRLHGATTVWHLGAAAAADGPMLQGWLSRLGRSAARHDLLLLDASEPTATLDLHASVERLLAAAPGLRLLACAAEPIGHPAEWAAPVAALDLVLPAAPRRRPA